MELWWWIEPLAKTGILFTLLALLSVTIGGRSCKDIFMYLAFIFLIPILVAIGGIVVWIFYYILASIWMPYF